MRSRRSSTDPGVEILEPEFRKRSGGIVEFLATYSTGATLIFLHRDSESLTLDERLREFEPVERQGVVPVVPVRMSEAWLLFDSSAIARAAGSRETQVAVPHPRAGAAGISSVQSRVAA